MCAVQEGRRLHNGRTTLWHRLSGRPSPWPAPGPPPLQGTFADAPLAAVNTPVGYSFSWYQPTGQLIIEIGEQDSYWLLLAGQAGRPCLHIRLAT